MNNKFILDLTVQLTQALDQNYDVVNMDTVLAVISALEGATITKEQLETTRLAKHINQLRRRNKSNIIAIRAKNLLKKWREKFGITSLAQSEVASAVTMQSQPTQQQAPRPPISSTSQPASPYTAQLLGENFDNSLSSIGGGVEFISRTVTSGISNTGSANFTFNKKTASEANGPTSTRSNGALTDTQTRLMKSSNRSIINNYSPSLPAAAAVVTTTTNTTTTATTITITGNKVKHPTSFKNLIAGFATNSVPKLANLSALSPKLKVPPASGVSEMEEMNLKTNSTTYIIDDDDNQSQPASTGVAQTGVSSPRTHKSTKRKERDSPVTMAFNMEHSNSPLGFENLSSLEPGRAASQTTRHNNVNQIVTSTIDLHDSNSSSNFVNSLGEVTEINTANSSGRVGLASSNSSSKRIRKDKKRSNERVELVTESEHFQPTIDESSRIAFPISGIQEYLSLSNSSMSIFPSQQTAGSGGTERYPPKAGSNEDQPLHSLAERNSEVLDGDLTFAGKFKQSNSSSGLEVGSSSNYFSNGGENMSVKSGGFPCGNMKVAINNCRDSVNAGAVSSTTFLPFSRNSNESTSNSRISQLDLIDVVNQDSQSMITVDDLRQQQSSNDKINKTQRDVENAQAKYIKESSNTSKQYSKEQTKSATIQRPINASSKPSTPTSATNAAAAISTLPAEQKVPKKRGRKKGSKGVDSVLAQSACLSAQFLMSPALGSNKKVKTTMELLADIQNRKLGSATSSPTLMNWFGASRPASSCSEPSLHSPRTSDACSTNATMSTAALSTPEKNISNNSVAADELYESDSDSNTSERSHDSIKMPLTNAMIRNSQSKAASDEVTDADGVVIPTSTIEDQIKELMAQLPPVDLEKIDWEAYEDVPCTCTLLEVPPEVEVPLDSTVSEDNKAALGLLENVEDIKIKEHDSDEPIISVSVQPLAMQKPSQAKLWSPMPPHSQSAPVSAVTSPIVPSTNQKPMKSIFDLDFDDDNDPLHSFVEAASKPKTENSSTPENGRIHKDEQPTKLLTTDHSDVVKDESIKQESTQSELIEETSPVQPSTQPLQQNPHIEGSEPLMMPPMLMNFPTYEVVEDSECQAKQRYEIQTNEITQFHINAFHNCFIPNVNGNWDHSTPQNVDDENRLLENDSLYANVVPRYGCFVIERIPKDLSHVKFTKDFRPKTTKKSNKPSPPFLGVANIHRRQHFRLRHQQRHKKKLAIKKKIKQTKKSVTSKPEPDKIKTEIKEEKSEELESVHVQPPNETAIPSNIPETNVPVEDIEIDSEIKCSSDHQIQPEQKPSPTNLLEVNLKSTKNTIDDQEQCKAVHENNLNKKIRPAIDRNNGLIDEEFENYISSEPMSGVKCKQPMANGNLHHLTNNNSILHCSDENKSDISGTAKVLQNCNHNILADGMVEDGIAARRRSSSCSNSSLKQNQNSINMKLRRHRLEQQQLEQQKQNRKRLSSFTDVFDFDTDEAAESRKVPRLIKRIKIVNGEYAPARRLTNSVTDDDGDSDCYHAHSENDIITEEEIDDDADERIEDEYEDIADDYDEEDGDDEEDAEEDYGDFHEVVTRDMASTTGNNHIVLTIKKTPSKTNSPSSSSMSPALNVNAKVSSISPTIQSTVDALLMDSNAIELTTEQAESAYQEKFGKFLDLNTVKAVDLIGKTEFFLPETSDVAIYSFHLKKNGDRDHSDNENVDGNEGPDDENIQPDEAAEGGECCENAEATENVENPTNTETASVVEGAANPKEFKEITKAELSESIQLTKKHLRRQELKARLRQGIEEAQKLHRQLFFPFELHPTVGQKILEISSCTSDCTDPSEDETDDDETGDEDGDGDCDGDSTDTTSGSSSSSSSDGMDSRMQSTRRRRVKLRARQKRIGGGGGNPPSSSSSSSSSDSSSSSSSAFTSLSTTTSSSSDDEDRKRKKQKRVQKVAKKEEEIKKEQSSSSDNKPKEDKPELPTQNNFLLRSFNHIYVSTDERRRQEQLKRAAEYRPGGIINSGYISLTADDSKDDDTPSVSSSTPAPCASSSNCDLYFNYYNNNQNRNIYSISNNSSGTYNSSYNTLTTIPPPTQVATVGETPAADDQQPLNIETSLAEPSNVIEASSMTEQSSATGETTNNDSNCRINPDSSIGSNNDNNSSVQLGEGSSEQNLVAHEEYRTGLRNVDEDVDDEDGNNCARTQQFKEWHEVLQLRSYNDELLTVLPYVVIE